MMKAKSLITVSCLAVGVFGLSACSGPTKTAQTMQGDKVNSAAEQAAQTYAINSQAKYGQQAGRAEDGERINALKAPANQTYYFDFDSNNVKQRDYQALTIQAIYLANHPKAKVRLEGNTDNRGSREYNIALGWRRDQAIERLLEQQGVSRMQIDKVSYGKEHPAVYGNNDYAWRLNRRVNLIYEAY